MHDLNSMMHQCSICLKKFEYVSKLRRHQLTHSGQRPFICSICNKGFRQSAHLKRHLESHAKLRPCLVSGAADSEFFCMTSDSNNVPQANIFEETGISSDSELLGHSVWYNGLQTQNEREWKYVEEDCIKEQGLVDNSLRNTADSLTVTSSLLNQNHPEDSIAKKQTCGTVEWNYSGLAEKENDCQKECQNEQYPECRMPKTEPEPNPEKQELSGLNHGHDELLTHITVSNSSHGQLSVDKMGKTPKKHQCATCLKCFSAPSKLRRHILIHTSERPFSCQLCPKAFRQLAHLKIHLTTHFLQRQNKAKCKSRSPQSHGQQIKTNLKTPACSSKPMEGQWLADKRPLTEDPSVTVVNKSKENPIDVESLSNDVEKVKLKGDHMSRGKVMHECPVCFKCFSAPSKLRRHCLIHTGQRPFQCSECHRSFRQLAHLKAHYSIHTGPRKKSSFSLQLHRLVNQPQSSKTRFRHFVCTSLSRSFRYAKHQQKPSNLLDKGKTSPASVLSKSIRLSRTAGCQSDEDIWERDVRCTETKGSLSRQGYWCAVCSKCFTAPSKLRRHLLVHTGQRPFKCLVCFRAFTQRSHLKVHKCKTESQGAPESTSREVSLLEELDNHGPNSEMNMTEDAVNREQPSMGNSTMTNSMDSVIPSNSLMPSSHSIPEDNRELTSLPYADTPSENVTSATFEVPDIRTTAKQTKECGHQCTICLKIFDFPSKLSRHLLIHMDLKPFTCAICSKSFRQLCHLQSHEKVHTAKRKMMYKGSHKCRIVTSNMSETSEHLNDKNTCNQVLENLPLLQKTDPESVFMESSENQSLQLSAFNKSPPSCSWSAVEPSVKSTTDTGNPTFPNVVSSDFETQNVDMPAKVTAENSSNHNKHKPNQCNFCLKTFDFPSKLSRHLRIHTGIRPFECHVCHKAFKQLSHLQCHQWVHNRNHKIVVSDNVVAHQDPASSGCATMSEEQECILDPHQEITEGLVMTHQGQDAYTDQEQSMIWNHGEFGPSVQCSPSSLDHNDSKIKPEIYPQVDSSDNLVLKHEIGSSVIGADGVSRSLEWECLDQAEMSKTSDHSLPEERTENKHPQDIHYCVPDDCSNRSPTVSDCCRLGFSYEQQETSEFRGPKKEATEESCEKNFTEPPNDLPICPACSQCFPTLKKLHAHRCPMEGPEERLKKSYHCAVCFKSFEAPSKLKRHYVIHTGQRPYECTMCNKAFTQSGHLKTHMLSHR